MSGTLNLNYTYTTPSLLDLYPSATGAYSVTRKLRGGYGGKAFRVRRTSDNAEQDIGFVGGNVTSASITNFTNCKNLLTYSEEFNNSAWTKLVGTVTADATTAPDGTSTADKLTDSTAINIYQYITPTSSGTDHIFSCYLKKSGSVNNCDLYIYHVFVGFISQATFNLSNGTIVSQTYGSGATIEDVGNGWYRCSVHGTTGTDTTFGVYNTTEVFAWGAQVNTTTVTNYIKTTNAAYTGAYDGYVVKVYDQSGNANDLTQSTSTLQPQIVIGGSVITDGGKPSMTFNGTSSYFALTSNISGTSDWHCTMVHKRRASGVIGPQFAGGTSQYAAWLYSDNNWYARGREGFISSTSSGTLAAQCLATTEWLGGTSYTVYLNGTSLFSGTPSITATDNFEYLGRRGSDYADGNVQEVIIWKSNQSSNRSAIDTNIKNYYGL